MASKINGNLQLEIKIDLPGKCEDLRKSSSKNNKRKKQLPKWIPVFEKAIFEAHFKHLKMSLFLNEENKVLKIAERIEGILERDGLLEKRNLSEIFELNSETSKII